MDEALAIALAIASPFLLIFTIICILSIAYLFLFSRHRTLRRDVTSDAELGYSSAKIADVGVGLGTAKESARRFTSLEIDALTSKFSPSAVIGEGGFSTVYLASVEGSNVAIKVHNSSQRLHRAFRQELDILLCVEHPNIIRLLGYCDDRDEGILIFEYVSNGTLHDILHGNRADGAVLPWAHRTTILFSMAAALDYLHEGGNLQIIHGDIKSSNILLDSSLGAKLCDFGFARKGFSATVTRSENQMMGSLGYVDPHYLRSGLVSKKSDVYSFGVLVLELITGLEPFDPEKEQLLTTVMGPVLHGGDANHGVQSFVDRRLGNEYNHEEVVEMTSIAARCIAEQPVLRPTMAEVVNMMNEKVRIGAPKGEVKNVNSNT